MREGGREGERQKQEEKNDISILRPVLPVSGLISQCLGELNATSQLWSHLVPPPF